MTGTPRASIEALAREMGAAVARIERDLQQRFDAFAAELSASTRADMAAMKAQSAELELRAIKAEKALGEAVDARLANVRDGDSVSIDDVAPLLVRLVAESVAALPPPKDGEPGRDADPELVRALLTEAVAALPAPADGKDVDPEVIRTMVMEAVSQIEIPQPTDVEPIIESRIAEVLAKLDALWDRLQADIGSQKIDPDQIREWARGIAQSEIAAIPPVPPAVTEDRVRELAGECVTQAIAALPPPPAGERGPPGPQGKMQLAKAWSDGVHYEGNIVTHRGSTYQAARDTGREPPHDDWTCLASIGDAGADGRSFTVRGTWDAAAEYQALDVAVLGGSSFVARHDAPGVCPGDGWQLIASQGKRGQQGEAGQRGVGLPGPALVSASIDDTGLVVLRNADGTTVECDLYPVLSRIER